jgi:hypothetical protein
VSVCGSSAVDDGSVESGDEPHHDAPHRASVKLITECRQASPVSGTKRTGVLRTYREVVVMLACPRQSRTSCRSADDSSSRQAIRPPTSHSQIGHLETTGRARQDRTQGEGCACPRHWPRGGKRVSRCYLCVTLNTKTGSSGGRNLSYTPMKYGRDDWIRTSDPLTPSHRVACFLPLSPRIKYSECRQKHQHLRHIIFSSVFMAFHSSPVYSVTPT